MHKEPIHLSTETVEAICRLIVSGMTYAQIGRALSVSQLIVGSIARKVSHKEISDRFFKTPRRVFNRPPEAMIHKACKLLLQGKSDSYISTHCGLGVTTASRIGHKHLYKRISDQYFKEPIIRTNDTDTNKIHECCKLLQQGQSQVLISKKVGVSKAIITRIAQKCTHTDISDQYFKDKIRASFKLPTTTVHAICKELANGETINDISKKYNASVSQTYCIANKKSYRDISDQYFKDKIFSCKTPNKTVHKVCQLLISEKPLYSYKEISKRTGVSTGTIWTIRSKQAYADISDQYFGSVCRMSAPMDAETATLLCTFIVERLPEYRNIQIYMKDTDAAVVEDMAEVGYVHESISVTSVRAVRLKYTHKEISDRFFKERIDRVPYRHKHYPKHVRHGNKLKTKHAPLDHTAFYLSMETGALNKVWDLLSVYNKVKSKIADGLNKLKRKGDPDDSKQMSTA